MGKTACAPESLIASLLTAPTIEGRHVIHGLNGQKLLEGQWLNGKLDGPLTMWHETGLLRQEAHYRAGLLHGPYRHWHPTGQLAVEGQFHADKKTGVWRKWNEAGTLVDETAYG